MFEQPQCAIGVDPGTTTGVYRLTWDAGEYTGLAAQVPPEDALALIRRWADTEHAVANASTVSIAVEAFVIGARAARSTTRQGGRHALDLIGALQYAARDGELAWPRLRPAGQVKWWGTDHRLRAAGLTEGLRGRRHARDAARHALYDLVARNLAPDPLSSAFRTADTSPWIVW